MVHGHLHKLNIFQAVLRRPANPACQLLLHRFFLLLGETSKIDNIVIPAKIEIVVWIGNTKLLCHFPDADMRPSKIRFRLIQLQAGETQIIFFSRLHLKSCPESALFLRHFHDAILPCKMLWVGQFKGQGYRLPADFPFLQRR